jgi:hypothetical protein
MGSTILGLVGATGCGKTTLASRLTRDHGFVNLHMGRPLKRMLIALGLSEEDVAGTPEQRERPQALLGGASARRALSTLGTDWGRNMITADLWANAMKVEIEKHLGGSHLNPSPIVIDDLRFPNDWSVVQHFGGILLTIRRPSVERSRTPFDQIYHRSSLGRLLRGHGVFGWQPIHETEFYWPDAPSVAEVWNISTVDDLVASALTHWP